MRVVGPLPLDRSCPRGHAAAMLENPSTSGQIHPTRAGSTRHLRKQCCGMTPCFLRHRRPHPRPCAPDQLGMVGAPGAAAVFDEDRSATVARELLENDAVTEQLAENIGVAIEAALLMMSP